MTSKATETRTAQDYVIAARKCEILSLEHLLDVSCLVVASSNLVHALQRERGASSMYLGALGKQQHDPLLRETVDESRRFASSLTRSLDDMDINGAYLHFGSHLFNCIAFVVQGLEELEAVRERIRARELTPDVVINGYSKLIRSLLNMIFDAADATADPDISRALIALFNFMQGKELAGQERALGATAFGGNEACFSPRAMDSLQQLIEGQEHCFKSFEEFAGPDARDAWRALNTGPHTADVERLRRIACTSPGALARKARAGGGGQNNTDLSKSWFEGTTRRIDAMKAVEDQLQQALTTACEQKIQHARQALGSTKLRIAELRDHQGNEPGKEPGNDAGNSGNFGTANFAVFFSDTADGAVSAYNTDGVGPRLTRSIVDLVQVQSRRLQAMHVELTAARAALDERKTVEKAKGLIMRYHGMTEEEAYQMLRRLAMRQGRKLAEVAAGTLDMEELLKKPETN